MSSLYSPRNRVTKLNCLCGVKGFLLFCDGVENVSGGCSAAKWLTDQCGGWVGVCCNQM